MTFPCSFRSRIWRVVFPCFFLARFAFGQAAIVGSAPVRMTPSTATPIVNGTFSVDVAVDLTAATGVAQNGVSPAALSAFRLPITFDKSRLQLTSIGAGQNPVFAAAGFDATDVANANTTGRLTITAVAGGATAPAGIVSVATLSFNATSAGNATITAANGISLSSAIQVASATLYGPAAISPAAAGGGVVVQTPAKLNLSLTAAPTPVASGSQLFLLLTIENTGGSTSTNVTVNGALPGGVTFLSSTPAAVVSGSTATWSLGNIAAGAKSTITATVSVTARIGSTVDAGPFTATAANVTTTVSASTHVTVGATSGLGPGSVLAASSFNNSGAIYDITTGQPHLFATVASGNWTGPLLITTSGRIFVATNANGGSVYDITTGGDLHNAPPIAQNLFGGSLAWIEAMTIDDAGNLYVANAEVAGQRVAKIAGDGTVSYLPPVFDYSSGLLASGNSLYVSEGISGSVKRIDLSTLAVTTFASGFSAAHDHFSGQLARDPRGHIFALWSTGLFDITAGGDFSAATPVTAQNAFRIDVNQIAIDNSNNVWFAGDGTGFAFKSTFAAGTFGAAQPFVGGLGDSESIAVYPVPPAPNLTTSIIASPTPAGSGSDLTYTLSYRNNGGAAASNVVVTDAIPNGATFVSASGGGVLTGSVVTWALPSLASQATGSFTLVVHVTAAAGTQLINAGASIRADGVASTTSASLVTNVVLPPSLTLSVTAASSIGSGSYLTYLYSCSNTGGIAATGVTTTNLVPIGTVFDSATNGATIASGNVTWSLGTIDPNSTQTFSMTVKVTASSGSTLNNSSAQAAATNAPAVAANTVSTSVLGVSALTITQLGAPNPTVVGGRVNFALTYKNTAPSAAANVVLTARLPRGSAFIGTTAGGTLVNGVVTWTIPSIAAGATATVRFSVYANVVAGSQLVSDDVSIVADANSRAGAQAASISVLAVPAGFGPGSLLDIDSNGSGTIWDLTDGTRKTYGVVPAYAGPIIFGADGHVYVWAQRNLGSLYDVTAGGNLSAAIPVADHVYPGGFSFPDGAALDTAGNFYVANSESDNQPIARITPFGEVSFLPPLFHFTGGMIVIDSTLYVSEGGTGTVKAVDLNTNNVTVFASGFRSAADHFSGQLARDPRGHLYVLWSTATSGRNGLFEITGGGNFAAAVPLTAENAFRIDVNQIVFDLNNNIYFAGNGNNNAYRALFNAATGTFGTATIYVSSLGDNESIGLYPIYNLSVAATASAPSVASGDAVTFSLNYTSHSIGPVTNGAITALVPAGTHVQSVGDGGVLQGNTITWPLGTVGAQASGSVSMTLIVDAPPRTSITFSNYSVAADNRPSSTGPAVTINVTGASNDALSVVASASASSIVQGGAIVYTLKFDNDNAASATSVVLTDPLPAGTTFQSASNGGSLQSGAVVWNLGTVAAGASGTVSFVVRGDTGPLITNSGYTIAAASLPTGSGPSVSTQVLAPSVILQISATETPNPATSGQTLTYAIHAANAGESSATAAVIDLSTPSGLTFVSTGGGGTATGTHVAWSLGTIAASGFADVTATFNVTANAGATITLSDYGITSAQTARVPGPSITTPVAAAPPPEPLALTTTASPNPVTSGALLAYQITVTNPASVAANGVVITDAIPAGTSLVSTSGPAISSSTSVQWSLGTLAAGGSIALGMTVRVTAPGGSAIVNGGATATAADRDAATSSAVQTSVVAPPAVSQLVLSAPAAVYSGGTIAYTLAYANSGPGTITGAAVTDPLPAGTTFVSASGGTLANGVVTWPLGTLAVGASGSLSLVVATAAPAGATITNSGSLLAGSGADSSSGNTVATDIVLTPAVFAGTLTTDKSNYHVPEVVHESATFTYVSGGAGLVTGLTATLTTTNGAGSVVASTSQPINSLTSGGVSPLIYDWNTTGASSGTYTIVFTVSDAAGNVLLRRSLAVSVAAPDGAHLTGAIEPANSPVPLGVALQVHITIQNQNAIAYAALPLEVDLLDPASLAVRKTVQLTLAVGANAGAATDASIPTNGLATGNYLLWLTTSSGSGHLLATSSASIIAPTLALSPASLTLVAGSSGTLTATLGSPLTTPASLVLTSSAPSIVSVPASLTIPAGAVSVSVPLQALGVGGPVTITASLGAASASSSVTVVLSGSLTATLKVTQGETVSFGVTITNSGQTSLTGASFAVEIRNPSGGGLVDIVPFTVSVAAGASYTTTLPYVSSPLAAQKYEARLVFNGVSPHYTLATAPFEVVLAAPLRLAASVGTSARVLIWSNCSPGNSGTPCTPVAPPFLTKTLRDAAIPYVVAGDENSFLAKMRTGAFSCAVIDQAGASEQKIAAEYLADIHAGVGLLFIHSAPNAMPKLAPALATDFLGTLHGPATLNLLSTPFTTPGTLALNGDGVTIRLVGAHAAATIAGGTPAMSYATYGAGNVVVVPFDLEQTPTTGVASLILSSIGWISRPATASANARDVVPLRFAVTTPPGGQVPITVTVTLPSSTSVIDAVPSLSSTSPINWSALVPGNSTAVFDLWIRLPNVTGTVTVTIDAGNTGGPPLVTKTIDLTVALDAAALASRLSSDLAALKSAALTHNDQKAIDDAIAQLAAVTPSSDPLANVQRILTIISDLDSMSVNTTAARGGADRLLTYWQSRIGA
jgi:uncharacterized repeat protein (TIGR01451 family)